MLINPYIFGIDPGPGPGLEGLMALHFDGMQGKTTIIDSGSSPGTWACNGGAVLTSTTSYSGKGCSIDIPSGAYLTGSGSPTLAGDFTIRLRFKAASTSGYQMLFNKGGYSEESAANAFKIYLANGAIEIWPGGGSGTPILPAQFSISANTWYDLEVNRTSGQVRAFLNGNVGASFSSFTTTLDLSGLSLGNNGSNQRFVGQIDDVQIFNTSLHGSTSFDPATMNRVEPCTLAHRYWGIRILTNNGQSYGMLTNIILAATAGGSRITTNETKYANNTYLGVFGNNWQYAFCRTYNGDGASRWMENASSMPYSNGYDFTTPQIIKEIRIIGADTGTNAAYALKDFEIIYSDTNSGDASWFTAIRPPAQTGWLGSPEVRTFTVWS